MPSTVIGRTFSGNQFITFDNTGLATLTGAFTIALIVRHTTLTGHLDLIGTDAGGWEVVYDDNAGAIVLYNDTTGQGDFQTVTDPSVGGTYLHVVRKASGSVHPTFTQIDFADGVPHHNAGSTGTLIPNLTDFSPAKFGANTIDNTSGATIYIAGFWNRQLSDGEVEDLYDVGSAAWVGDANLKGLFFFDQTSTGTALDDFSGVGTGQTAITGTTVNSTNLIDDRFLRPTGNPSPATISTPITFPAPTVYVPSAVFIGEIGGNTSNSSGSTLAITTTQDVEVGDFVLIAVAGDNAGTSGAARTISAADNSAQAGTANTYNATNVNRTAASAANDGTTATVLRCNVTRRMPAGTVITLTFSGNLTSKAASAACFRNAFGPNISSNTASGASTTPSAASTPTAAGQLSIGIVAVEGGTADGFTQDSDTTNGAWVGLTRRGIGTTTSGQTINWAYKIVNASGAQTYNPTLGTSRDWAAICQTFPFNVNVPASRPGSPLQTPIIFPAPSVTTGGTDATASGPLVLTPITFPSLTVTSSPTPTPAVLSTPITFPAPIVSISRTATPGVLATPITFPAPAVASGTVAVPPVVATPITFPARTVVISATATPLLISTPITFPAVVVALGANPPLLSTPVTFPSPAEISSPTPSAPRVLVVISFPTPSITAGSTHTFSEPYSYPDGDLDGNGGWVSPAVGTGNVGTEVHSGRAAVDDTTLYHDAVVTIPFSVSHDTDWQMSFDTRHPLTSGRGGTTFAIFNGINGTGIGGFIGNASHIYFFHDGTWDTATNDGFSLPGDDVVHHVDFIHAADGEVWVYIDGVEKSHNPTSDGTGPFNTFYFSIGALDYPTTQSWIDNLFVYDFIPGPVVPMPAPDVLSTPIIFPAPVISISETSTPSVLATPVTFPAPSVSIGTVVSAPLVATPVSFPAPSVVVSPTASGPLVTTPVTFPAPTVTVSRTVAAPLLSTPITMAAPTITASGALTAPVVSTPVSFPARTIVISTTVSGPLVLTPITFPGTSVTAGGSATAQAPLIATPVSFPAVTITATATVSAPQVLTPISLPAPQAAVSRTATPGVVATPITFPSPSVTAGQSATATPPVIASPITFPASAAVISTAVSALRVLLPIVFPAVTVSTGSSALASAPQVLTPIVFPPASITVLTFADGPTVLTLFIFSAPQVHADQLTTAPLLVLPVLFPAPHVDTGVFTVVQQVKRMGRRTFETGSGTLRASRRTNETTEY